MAAIEGRRRHVGRQRVVHVPAVEAADPRRHPASVAGVDGEAGREGEVRRRPAGVHFGVGDVGDSGRIFPLAAWFRRARPRPPAPRPAPRRRSPATAQRRAARPPRTTRAPSRFENITPGTYRISFESTHDRADDAREHQGPGRQLPDVIELQSGGQAEARRHRRRRRDRQADHALRRPRQQDRDDRQRPELRAGAALDAGEQPGWKVRDRAGRPRRLPGAGFARRLRVGVEPAGAHREGGRDGQGRDQGDARAARSAGRSSTPPANRSRARRSSRSRWPRRSACAWKVASKATPARSSTDAKGKFKLEHLAAGDEKLKIVSGKHAPRIVDKLQGRRRARTTTVPPIKLSSGGAVEGDRLRRQRQAAGGRDAASSRTPAATAAAATKTPAGSPPSPPTPSGKYRVEHLPPARSSTSTSPIAGSGRASRAASSARSKARPPKLDFGGTTPVNGRLLNGEEGADRQRADRALRADRRTSAR